MKKQYINTFIYALFLLFGSNTLVAEDTSVAPELSPQEVSKLSEAFGHFIGKNLSSPGVQFDLDSVIKGLRDQAAGKPSPLGDQEYEQMMGRLQAQAYLKIAEDNLTQANDYIKKNANDSRVVVVEPGKLQYQILEQGTGETVQEHANPQIHYTGKYIDGTVFGSSEEAGGPITIPLDQTIPGFTKGIVGMKEGEKRRIFVHPELGYGTNGPLPPNSMLILDVEVVSADSPEEDQAE